MTKYVGEGGECVVSKALLNEEYEMKKKEKECQKSMIVLERRLDRNGRRKKMMRARWQE